MREKGKKKTPSTTDTTASTTKDAEIYRNIYAAIVDHRLAPGTKLAEDALAETFGVSRTIIRKVLQNLTHDGLVTTAPNRGSRVAHPTAKEGKEVFASRRLVEVAALPLVIENLTSEQLKELKVLDEAQKSAQVAFDQHNAIRLSGDFHAAIIAITDNKILIEFIRNLISQSSLIVAVYGSTKQNLPSCIGHSELLELLEAGKVVESQAWMDQHLQDIEAGLEFVPTKTEDINFGKIFF